MKRCAFEMTGSRFCECPKCVEGTLPPTIILPASTVEAVKAALESVVAWYSCSEDPYFTDETFEEVRAALALLEKP